MRENYNEKTNLETLAALERERERGYLLSSEKRKILKYVVMLNILVLLMLSNICIATSAIKDVTPPVGRIKIVGATEINNVNYVDRAEVQVEAYAFDDISPESEIKYYISTSEITGEVPTWYDYGTEKTQTIVLPNTTTLNTLYVVFKDGAGNTSLIYKDDNVKYTISYDANGGTEAPIGVGTTGYYGAPFVVTSQRPKREGYYFWGWSTVQNATSPSYYPGDIIPASVFVGGPKTITLYAVWSQTINYLPDLADVVKIGDYVNYPVYYDNVYTYNDSYKSTLDGWRVISKDVDLDGNVSEGTVNLVSAGVPFTYYNYTNSSTSVPALTTNFLTTPFAVSGNSTYRKTGFLAYQSLANVFTNKYTEMKEDGVTPKVRAMVQEDIFRITGHTAMATGTTMALADAKYQKLFVNGAYYWLASPYPSSSLSLWYVLDNGYVSGNDGSEYGVRPVVSLKSTVKAIGTDVTGAWQIGI